MEKFNDAAMLLKIENLKRDFRLKSLARDVQNKNRITKPAMLNSTDHLADEN